MNAINEGSQLIFSLGGTQREIFYYCAGLIIIIIVIITTTTTTTIVFMIIVYNHQYEDSLKYILLLGREIRLSFTSGFINPWVTCCPPVPFVWPSYIFYNIVALCVMKNSYLISENTIVDVISILQFPSL
jgi:hypothetical protein